MSDDEKVEISLDVLANEFAPLPRFESGLFSKEYPENKVLKTFLAVSSAEAPALIGLEQVGFDFEQMRKFLSLYAGMKLSIPSKEICKRKWLRTHLWRTIGRLLDQGHTQELAFKIVSERYGVTCAHARAVFETYEKAYQNCNKGK